MARANSLILAALPEQRSSRLVCYLADFTPSNSSGKVFEFSMLWSNKVPSFSMNTIRYKREMRSSLRLVLMKLDWLRLAN